MEIGLVTLAMSIRISRINSHLCPTSCRNCQPCAFRSIHRDPNGERLPRNERPNWWPIDGTTYVQEENVSDTESARTPRHTECPDGFEEVPAQPLECEHDHPDPGMPAEDESQTQGVLENVGDQEEVSPASLEDFHGMIQELF